MKHILLVGNPNSGKTTLFNALTGENQKVGNWPGVTVEKKTGVLTIEHEEFEITDLPGIYSLTSSTSASQDEQIAALGVAQLSADIILNVVDACHLERHLYLTSQLLELGKPLILALNMTDIAKQRGIVIDTQALSKQLKCPVVELQAHRNVGVDRLKTTLKGTLPTSSSLLFSFPQAVQDLVGDIEQKLLKVQPTHLALYTARRIVEGDRLLSVEEADLLPEEAQEFDIIMADARYQAVHDLVGLVQRKASDASEHFTAKLDRLVLHRFWSLPIFLGVMYGMFLFAINIGGAFQEFFDISTDTLFVQGPAWLLEKIHAPNWLIALLANGIGKGINTTLTFIPVIAGMFFFLAFLEISGYMARAAFVVDKIMRALGLPGKSFVPMIVGFGCNVPAIMAARTLDSERDRLLTVLMSPFMSCSARLAIYAVFVAAFFPTGGQNIVFSLYMIGILMAVLTGFLLRKTMLKGQASPLILELPAYHKPSLQRLIKDTSLRLKYFVLRAGKLIIPVCVILGGLNALTIHGGIAYGDGNSESVLAWLAQMLTPIFSPMGIHNDNWPATVGLLTGMLAKEVVVGSLNSLYAQMGEGINAISNNFDFWGSLQAAVYSIPHNIAELGPAFLNPILASAPDGEVSQTVYGIMASHFDGKAGAFAYLLFILLYIPCVSTMAAIRQESNRRLMWFSVAWSFVVAYASAVLFYQAATFLTHPQQTIGWMLGVSLFVIAFIWLFKHSTILMEGRRVIADS